MKSPERTELARRFFDFPADLGDRANGSYTSALYHAFDPPSLVLVIFSLGDVLVLGVKRCFAAALPRCLGIEHLSSRQFSTCRSHAQWTIVGSLDTRAVIILFRVPAGTLPSFGFPFRVDTFNFFPRTREFNSRLTRFLSRRRGVAAPTRRSLRQVILLANCAIGGDDERWHRLSSGRRMHHGSDLSILFPSFRSSGSSSRGRQPSGRKPLHEVK